MSNESTAKPSAMMLSIATAPTRRSSRSIPPAASFQATPRMNARKIPCATTNGIDIQRKPSRKVERFVTAGPPFTLVVVVAL